VLSAHQAEVARRSLAERAAERRHVVVYLSGAHAYGFPSPDSDLDLKCVHVAPTGDLVGLEVLEGAAERTEVVEGVELDYGSNELGPVLRGVIKGNGNYIERVLGALLPYEAPELEALRPLVRRCLSKRLYRHYLGFATSQLKAFENDGRGSAKKLLYVLRTTLTGAHALLTGEIVIDLRELLDAHGFGEARELVEAKRAGEASRLSEEAAARWGEEAKRAFGVLAAAHERSSLPAEPEGAADLEAWLLEERRRRF